MLLHHYKIHSNLNNHSIHLNQINQRFIHFLGYLTALLCFDYMHVHTLSISYHKCNKIDTHICKSCDCILQFFPQWTYSSHIVWNADCFVKNRFPADHILLHVCPKNISDRILAYKFHKPQVNSPPVWWFLHSLLWDRVLEKGLSKSCKNCEFWHTVF